MLVVISDLHFQDTDIDPGFKNIIKVDRNVDPKAFHILFSDIAELASENKANEIIVALAGDIFDINRSSQWLKSRVRPYTNKINSELDKVLADIWNGIVTNNSEALQIFTEVGKIKDKAKNADYVLNIDGFEKITFPSGLEDVRFEYITGNHDRLVNLSDYLQNQMRTIFGMPKAGDTRFQHELTLEKYGVFIRHGHEYDSQNFPQKLNPEDLQSSNAINSKSYDEPVMGDGATVDLAAALPYEFALAYKFKIINNDRLNEDSKTTYRDIYKKLLEFDDVRPMSELIRWLEYEVDGDTDAVWKVFDPVFRKVIERWFNDPFLKRQIPWLKRLLSTVLKPKTIIKSMTGSVAEDETSKFAFYDSMRFVNAATDMRYVVYGHTHDPKVDSIRSEGGRDMFSFDTGTWRKRIKLCEDEKSFAWTKMLTYVVFYNKNEDMRGKAMPYSFDVWSGHTKK